jgi:anti-sigma factor RsiW
VEAGATSLGHQEAQALFAPAVDHELPPEKEVALKSHLEGCQECQQGFEKYTRAVQMVRSVHRERAPADFTAQVLKRVRKRRRSIFGWQGGRFFEHISIPVEAAIAVILAAAIAALVIYLLHLH